MTQIVLRIAILAVIAYLLALLLARLLGRKLISQMTFFDFIVGVALGSAVVNAAIITPYISLSGFVILIVISVLTLIIDYSHVKSITVHRIVQYEPVVVIENGRIVDGNLKRIRLNLEELMMKLREKDVFNVSDVEFAIMEIDGNLSVQLKSQKQPVTPADLKMPTEYRGLTRDLVIDGKIIDENLNYIKLSKQWLVDKLKEFGIPDYKNVFYAGIDTTGNLYVSKKQQGSKNRSEAGLE